MSNKFTEMQEKTMPSAAFIEYWNAGAIHVYRNVCDNLGALRLTPISPMYEHYAFILGNQLFFAMFESDEFPLSKESKLNLDALCLDSNATPLILQLKKVRGKIEVVDGGSGLRNMRTNELVNPIEMVNDSAIPMEMWDCLDCLSKGLAEQLTQEGARVHSRVTYVGLQPSFWYEKDGKEHFVVLNIRVVKNKGDKPDMPVTGDLEKEFKEHVQKSAPHAKAMICNAVMACGEEKYLGEPPYRGMAVYVDTQGLQEF